MTSLSDRNMSLGDVLLPQGGKQRCLCPRVQGLFTLRKVLLMQLSVALSLHYGWDSQLNTSEMFWIDISRWMISSRYWWISVYLLWRTAHALNLNLSCNVVSIGLRSWSCQLPSCNLLPHIVVLSSFGRETSLVNIMRLRSILPWLITSAIYFSAFTYYCKNYLSLLSLLLTLCELQGRRDWQPLYTRWEQSYLYLCAGPRWLLICAVSSWHLLVEPRSLSGFDPWHLC